MKPWQFDQQFELLERCMLTAQELQSLCDEDRLHQIPVLPIRWTHDTIDGRSIFQWAIKGKSLYDSDDSAMG